MRFSYASAFLVIAVLCNATLAVFHATPLTTIVAALLYLIALLFAFRSQPAAFLLFSPIAVLHFSVLVSLIAIESGAQMKEMGQTGFASASGAIYLVFVGLFLAAAVATFSWLEARLTKKSFLLAVDSFGFIACWAAPAAVILVICYLVLKGLSSGFPLLMGADRFFYRREFGDPLMLNFLNLKIVLAAFLGISAANCRTATGKLAHHATFMAYLGVSFLFGDKFFSIINASLFYLAAQMVGDPSALRQRARRFLPLAAAALLVAVCMTTYIYSAGGTLGYEKTAKLLLDRLSGQGQLWFLAFTNEPAILRFDSDAVRLNLHSLIANPAQDYVFDKRIGPFHFVEKYAPTHMLLAVLGNAGYVAPTMVYEAYALELFGFGGLTLLASLAGVVLGAIAFAVLNAAKTGNPFGALLPAFVYVQFYYLIGSGTIYNVLGLGSLKGYAAFFVLQVIVAYWVSRSVLPSALANAVPARIRSVPSGRAYLR